MNAVSMHRTASLVVAVVVLVMGGFVPQALATDYTWEGDDPTSPTDWAVTENWDLGAVPGAADTAVFDAGTATGFTADVGADTGAAKIDFNNVSDVPANQFEIAAAGGGGNLLLGDGTQAAEIEHDAVAATPQDGASLISADVSAVVVGAATRDLAFDVNSGTLTLSGRIGTDTDQVKLVAPGDAGFNVEADGVLALTNDGTGGANNLTGTLTVAGELRATQYGLTSTGTAPTISLDEGTFTFVAPGTPAGPYDLGNDVTVNGASGIGVTDQVNLGNLTLNDGSTLGVTAAGAGDAGVAEVAAFTQTSIPGAAPVAVGVAAEADTTLSGGPLYFSSQPVTLTKQGAGSATFEKAVALGGFPSVPVAGTLVLDVQDGELAFTDQMGADGAPLTVTGSTVAAPATLGFDHNAVDPTLENKIRVPCAAAARGPSARPASSWTAAAST